MSDIVGLPISGAPPEHELMRIRALLDARATLDREPALPPFKRGDTVRYIGPTLPACVVADGILFYGLTHGEIVRIGATLTGYRGNLEYVKEPWTDRMLWWDKARRIPVLDTTVDGTCSIVRDGVHIRGYLIDASNAHEWEIV